MITRLSIAFAKYREIAYAQLMWRARRSPGGTDFAVGRNTYDRTPYLLWVLVCRCRGVACERTARSGRTYRSRSASSCCRILTSSACLWRRRGRALSSRVSHARTDAGAAGVWRTFLGDCCLLVWLDLEERDVSTWRITCWDYAIQRPQLYYYTILLRQCVFLIFSIIYFERLIQYENCQHEHRVLVQLVYSICKDYI